MKIDLIAFNCRYTHSCLALFYVRNELVKNLPACATTIRQFTINDPYYETLLKIKDDHGDALFFSVYIWNATYLTRLLNDLHAIIPDTPIVLGGPQAPSLSGKINFRATVVHNHIEGVAPTFYDDLEKNTLRQEYFSSPINTFGYPYKQEDFQGQLKNRNIYYESSRGCPFFCSYCLSSISRGVLSKDIDQVKTELFDILQHSPKGIRFVDRTFNANPERALTIWKFLLDQANIDCLFHFEIAPDLFTEEMFCFLEANKKNNFKFEIGVQSTNPKTLGAVNRKIDIEKSLRTIKRLIKIGSIDIHIDLILGLPEENKESFAQSVRDIFVLQPNYLQMGLLKVLPDTEIYNKKNEFGIISCLEPPYQVLSTKSIDSQTISNLYWIGECIESFYNKRYFKTFFYYISSKEIDIYLFFSDILKLCKYYNFFYLAKTQEFMNNILNYYIECNKDVNALREFLIFDWLSFGHRYLPSVFNEDIKEYKKILFKNSPSQIKGMYTENEKNMFFKQGVFFKFSPEMLFFLKLTNSSNTYYVGFFIENKNKTITKLIPFIDNENN